MRGLQITDRGYAVIAFVVIAVLAAIALTIDVRDVLSLGFEGGERVMSALLPEHFELFPRRG